MRSNICLCKIRYLLLLAALLTILIPTAGVSAASANTTTLGGFDAVKQGGSDSKPYLKAKHCSLLIGNSGTLNVYNVGRDCDVNFRSSDESILGVKKISGTSGEYRGYSVGTATITVKVREQGFLFMSHTTTLTYKVEVTPKAVSIKFRKNKYKLPEGTKKRLKLTIRPSISNENPVFDSSNDTVVSVNNKGLLYARSTGKAYITASISNGKTAKCQIIVKATDT